MEPETQKLFFRGKEKEDYDYLQMAGIKDNAMLLLVEDTRAKEISPKEINETSEISRGSEAVAEIRAEVDNLAEKVKNLLIAIFFAFNFLLWNVNKKFLLLSYRHLHYKWLLIMGQILMRRISFTSRRCL